MFVVPSLIMGFLFSLLALHGINKSLFEKDSGMGDSALPSGFAVVQALIVGLIIPLLSSIAPI